MSKTTVLIVAAGRGTRAPGAIPKQYRDLAGRPVLARTIAAFRTHERIEQVLVVIAGADAQHYAHGANLDPPKRAFGGTKAALLPPVIGGATRAESVLNGLRALAADGPQNILIHDAARPLISAAVISRVVESLETSKAAVPTLPSVDSMRRLTATGTLGEPVPRDDIRRAQTPQGFRFDILLPLMETAATNGTLAALTDEAEPAIAAGIDVASVEGDPMNFKLTIPEDFTMAERLLSAPDIRTGQGFDVHAFGDGDHVTLCGVTIPHERGLMGHSDADVGLHTITDALLGAVAEGDIGRHFPPSDPQWKGMDSAVFLRRAVEIVAERGYTITNIDATLICEEPKIGPHAPAMIARVAELCGLEPDRVSIKATTTEQLGFTGRREGIAAQAVVTVIGTRAMRRPRNLTLRSGRSPRLEGCNSTPTTIFRDGPFGPPQDEDRSA